MNPQVWWYVARSAGIVAWMLVTLSVGWGLFISTKAMSRAVKPAALLDLHRFLGGLSVVFTGIHLLGLVLDDYVHFGVVDILVPWAASWKPTAVAWGVVAFYMLVAIEVTSLLVSRLPRRLWRGVHRSSFALYPLATFHGIQAGTDTGNRMYQMAMLASVNIIAFLVVVLVLAHRRRALPA